jgi:hypothetical protein
MTTSEIMEEHPPEIALDLSEEEKPSEAPAEAPEEEEEEEEAPADEHEEIAEPMISKSADTKNPSSGLARKLAKSKPKAKAKVKDPRGSSSRKITKGKTMAGKKKDGETNGAEKVGISITPEAAKAVRKMRAKMELDTGDRTSNSDAIVRAVSVALES